MIRLLESAAASAPTRTAVVTPEASPSYRELLHDARLVGAALRARGVTRFAVVEADVVWVLRLLAGAALVGAEPCQYQADIAPHEFAEQAAALDHTVVVTRRDGLDAERFDLLSPEALLVDTDATVPEPSDADAQPLMIRTTGTTGLPKAARHDWRVLGRTVERATPRPEQRWLLAYGPHQFAGIQVLQHVLAAQATLVAPFPRQPRDGLTALREHDINCVSATPTYWRFLLAEARSQKVELPPLEQVTLGGEASPSDLLDELRAVFPQARVSHVYASTEFGSIASVRDGRPGFPVEALFGEANPGSRLRVRDGELWVRSGAGMLGYAGGAAAPEFSAENDWQPTGDMVEIVDGRVEFRGRDSEVINVGGVKVHPLPVEERINALPSVAAARVFGRANRLTGSIVAAEVVPAGDSADTDAIRRQIKEALTDLPPAWRPRSIGFVEELATRGGKTLRGTQQ